MTDQVILSALHAAHGSVLHAGDGLLKTIDMISETLYSVSHPSRCNHVQEIKPLRFYCSHQSYCGMCMRNILNSTFTLHQSMP